ncbi:hypothetical protein M5C72_10130 [Companilactobacillus allii]|uniref:HTH marR-type domain-containing protein n=1 Tax=Companilactobacillus allii TaxID=1847728 RepID=A0A1P8PZR9_9LACO|nr:hypothetical protein [Companilactobacillus allii]APX71120.1 hypothetical protein BTM29_00505 [Companilactobacillus allii]USQ68199.1 hypothetical protein M5C72_10130 [Companilactobacillus allii]
MENIIELLNQFLANDSKNDQEKKWALDQTNDPRLKNIIKQCDTREFRLVGLFKNSDTILLKSLPEKLKVSQATSSRSATKLQRLKVIDKFKDEDNKKEWQLRLTSEGQELLKVKIKLDKITLLSLQKATSKFSDEDIRTIIDFLRIIVNDKR